MTIGKMFREMRLKKHRKIEDVAIIATLTPEILANIEQDKWPISDGAIVYDLAQLLNVSTGELLNNPQYESHSRKEARTILRPYLWQLAKERGERLKMRREYVGYSIAEVAEQLDRSASFVNEHERGTTLGIPYETAQAFAQIYECETDWVLGNQPGNLLGQSITNSVKFCRQDLFWIYPAHISELQTAIGISERHLAREIGVPVTELRAYFKLPRIEISEPSFIRLCKVLKVGPKELRMKPIQGSYLTPTKSFSPEEVPSDTLCANIISAVGEGIIAKNKFCRKFNLTDAQWQMIQSKKMRFSQDAIAAIYSLLCAKQV